MNEKGRGEECKWSDEPPSIAKFCAPCTACRAYCQISQSPAWHSVHEKTMNGWPTDREFSTMKFKIQ